MPATGRTLEISSGVSRESGGRQITAIAVSRNKEVRRALIFGREVAGPSPSKIGRAVVVVPRRFSGGGLTVLPTRTASRGRLALSTVCGGRPRRGGQKVLVARNLAGRSEKRGQGRGLRVSAAD